MSIIEDMPQKTCTRIKGFTPREQYANPAFPFALLHIRPVHSRRTRVLVTMEEVVQTRLADAFPCSCAQAERLIITQTSPFEQNSPLEIFCRYMHYRIICGGTQFVGTIQTTILFPYLAYDSSADMLRLHFLDNHGPFYNTDQLLHVTP